MNHPNQISVHFSSFSLFYVNFSTMISLVNHQPEIDVYWILEYRMVLMETFSCQYFITMETYREYFIFL